MSRAARARDIEKRKSVIYSPWPDDAMPAEDAPKRVDIETGEVIEPDEHNEEDEFLDSLDMGIVEPFTFSPLSDWQTGLPFPPPKTWRDNPDNLTDPTECKCSYSRTEHTVFCPTGFHSRPLGPNECDPWAGQPKTPYRDRISPSKP